MVGVLSNNFLISSFSDVRRTQQMKLTITVLMTPLLLVLPRGKFCRGCITLSSQGGNALFLFLSLLLCRLSPGKFSSDAITIIFRGWWVPHVLHFVKLSTAKYSFMRDNFKRIVWLRIYSSRQSGVSTFDIFHIFGVRKNFKVWELRFMQ